MKKPVKVKNQNYLRKWDSYINSLPYRQAALLPLDIDIRDGKIYRKRILGPAVEKFYNDHRKEIPDYMRSFPDLAPTMHDFPNIDGVVDHYVENINDGGHSGGGLTPLDIITNRPTYMLFRIDRDDISSPPSKYLKWRFSEDKQITCHNDGLGPFRNLLPICTLDDGKALLAYNRHRCDPRTMKFDLHVTIHQKVKVSGNSILTKTPIIIDPGLGNGDPDMP